MTISKVRGEAYDLSQERAAYDLPHLTLHSVNPLYISQLHRYNNYIGTITYIIIIYIYPNLLHMLAKNNKAGLLAPSYLKKKGL